MGKITASTEAISASALDLSNVGSDISGAVALMSQSSGAATGTQAAPAYEALCAQLTQSGVEFRGAADQMAAAAEAAAECYIASDRLTN